jgi:nicotinamide riboside kinase
MNVRIAIIGSQSCGKTTLGRELSKKLDLPMISELARRWNIEKVSQTELIDIQKELLNLQIEEESKYEQFISDRSTIDNMSYWLHNVANIVSYDDNRQYKMKAIENVKTYSHIFLLVPEFYPKDDGFRNTDIIYQMRIDAIIQAILHLEGISHYKLTGSIENRVQQAMEILGK